MGKPDKKHKKKEKMINETETSTTSGLSRDHSVFEIDPPKKHKKHKKHKEKAVTEASSADNGPAAESNTPRLDEIEHAPRMSPIQRKARKEKKVNFELDQTEEVSLTAEAAPVPEPAPVLDIAPEKTASCCHCFSFFRKKPTKETQPLLQTPTASMQNN